MAIVVRKMHPDAQQVVDGELALEQVRRETRAHVGAVTGLVVELLLDVRHVAGGGAEKVRRVVVRGNRAVAHDDDRRGGLQD